MKINQIFKKLYKWVYRNRKAEILSKEEEGEQVIIHVSIKRKFIPYKNKHEVAIALMKQDRTFQHEGVLHNIHDFTYEYRFQMEKEQLENRDKGENFHWYLKVGEKKYPIK